MTSPRKPRVTMLLENNPFPQDVRVHREARSLVAGGFRVTVVAPRGKTQPRREQLEGVDVRRFRLRAADGGTAALSLEFALASLILNLAAIRALAAGAKVLHLHNPPDTLFFAGWIARLLGRRVVFDHHDLTPELVATRTDNRLAIAIARRCERETFRVASQVLSSNDSYAEVARVRGGKRPEDVVVVRNGPPEETLSLGAGVRPGALSDPRLVYVGTLAPQDNAEDLPTVLALLRDRHGIADATLTIVGDGSSRRALMAEAERWDVGDRITITGWVESDHVPPIIREADICVDPARPTPLNDRSTMIKIPEYLAAGRPVVAYSLTETRRTAADAACLAGDGDPARFAELVAELARNETLRRKASERARRRGPELTWERSEQQLLRAYERLCATP